MKVEDPQVTQLLHRQPPHTKLHRRPQHQPHQRQLHHQVLDKGAVFYVLCMVATIFVAKHHLTSSMNAHITAGTNTPFTPITEKGCAAFQTVIPIHHRFWTIRFLCWDGVCFGIGPIACFACWGVGVFQQFRWPLRLSTQWKKGRREVVQLILSISNFVSDL